jgi:hypothetical protein
VRKLFVLVGLLLLPPTARADVVTFDFDFTFSGSDPDGPPPWLTATFLSGADCLACDPGEVRLTLDASGLTGVEFASNVYFNFDPLINPINVGVQGVDISDVSSVTVSFGTDAFHADGDGFYDLLLSFPPPPGDFASKFTSGESIILDFSCSVCSTFDASSFLFLSLPGPGESPGPFYAAAHVQGIGPDGSLSGWVAGDPPPPTRTPEPASGFMLATGLGLIAFRRRSRR